MADSTPFADSPAAADANNRAVYVTNLSANADASTVQNFFSFCGQIVGFELEEDPSNTEDEAVQHALVVFKNEPACKTALLLSNAQIVDRPITVAPYGATEDAEASLAAEAARVNRLEAAQDLEDPAAISEILDETTGDNSVAQTGEDGTALVKSKTAVMAELVAAGYSLGGDTIGRARAYDEEHMRVIARAKEAAAAVKAKLESLDEKYGVTAKLTEVSRKVNAELAKLDEAYGVTAKVADVRLKAGAAAAVAGATAMQNKHVSAGVGAVRGAAKAVKGAASDFKQKTSAEIARRQAEREALEGPKADGGEAPEGEEMVAVTSTDDAIAADNNGDGDDDGAAVAIVATTTEDDA